jgi:hypothetical protein
MRILRLRRAAAASDVDAAAAAGGTPVSPTKTNEEPVRLRGRSVAATACLAWADRVMPSPRHV